MEYVELCLYNAPVRYFGPICVCLSVDPAKFHKLFSRIRGCLTLKTSEFKLRIDL